MDWSNEAYVRLYVRNTTTWRRLGFEGQTMLMHLLRVVDRAGVLDIEDMSPAQAAALHIGAPEDFAAAGMAKILELKSMIHDGTRLVFPNFIEAQESSKSDKQRQKESREKRAVTKRDEQSQNVTKSHELSQAVTSGHSLLCSALPSSAEEELRPPPARDGSEVSIGHDLLVNATGIPYPPSDWRRELERIGLKPELERTAVLAAIRGDPWCRANKLAIDPTHVLKQWAKYAAGNPALKQVVRAARFAGPSEVPTNPQDYAVNGDIKW